MTRDDLDHEVQNLIQGEAFLRAVFSGVPRGHCPEPLRKVSIRRVLIRQQAVWQFSSLSPKQDRSHNVSAAELPAELARVLAFGFSVVFLQTQHEEVTFRLSKKFKVLRTAVAKSAATPQPIPDHNRIKKHALPEGQPDRFLQVLGIMTADGRVKPTMRDKFTQVNEFLKHLDHTLRHADLQLSASDAPLTILDCGCGSSWLTLAVHHSLKTHHHRSVRVIGIDANPDVIATSQAKAKQLGVSHEVVFQHGTIGQFHQPADIVVSLHACDTATDEALAQAVRSQAKIILSVPCCHKDLNRQLQPRERMPELTPLLRTGLFKHRVADMLTDTFRAMLLQLAGYTVDVVEFVATDHTPRNVLIRAVRTRQAAPRVEWQREYHDLKQYCGVVPYLETLVPELSPLPHTAASALPTDLPEKPHE